MKKRNLSFWSKQALLAVCAVAATALLAISLCFFVWVLPRVRYAARLEQAQSRLAKISGVVQESRIVTVQLTQVDPQEYRSALVMEGLVQRLQNLTNENQELLQEEELWQQALSAIEYSSDQQRELYRQHQEVQKQQESVSSELSQRFQRISVLLRYQPAEDLLQLETNQEFRERRDLAITGLTKIRASLESVSEAHSLIEHLDRALQRLEALDTTQPAALEAFMTEYANLKQAAYLYSIEPIRSKSGVELVQQQTNMLTQYQAALAEITARQQRLKQQRLFAPRKVQSPLE